MPKTKISEFSATPGNNTDIDGINIAEGCAPSGINDAIRELMSQLKDFQTGAAGDSFNGPVGTTTAAAGAFTTLSASGAVTLSGGTANGVPYLNGSKVLTTGSALTFDGTNFATTGSVTSAGANNSGNLAFTGTGNRITGDFSNATIANRVMFQTSAANSSSAVSVLPSGTNSTSALQVYNNSDPTNSSLGSLIVDSGALSLQSTIRGTGTYLPMTLWTGGSERMRLDTSGNVGIGTSSPAYKLDVSGGGGSIATARVINGNVGGSDGAQILLGNSANFTNAYFRLNGGGNSSQAGFGSLNIGVTESVPMAFYTNNIERARIDSSGNVGIGTSSPGYRLDVQGNSASQVWVSMKNTNASGTGGFFLGNDSFNDIGAIGAQGSSGSAFGGANSIYVGTWRAFPLAFITNNTERARIDSSGNLLMGTTSQLASTSFASFSTGNGWVLGIRNTANSSGINITNGSGTAGYSAIGFYNNGLSYSSCGTVTVSGTTTTYGTSSDYRMKENVQPMVGALARVAALKPVTYTWKSTGEEGEGFIAHELQEVCPSAVVGEKDAVDEDGKIKPQNIDTSFLVATLTAAIQEQQAIINQLTARIEALEQA